MCRACSPQRITRARHVEGTLIINYVDLYQGQPTRERLALLRKPHATGGTQRLPHISEELLAKAKKAKEEASKK